MKLIELLGEKLKEWPTGFNYITQDKTGHIYASVAKPSISDGIWLAKRDSQKIGHAELCLDWDKSIIIKDDFTAQ